MVLNDINRLMKAIPEIENIVTFYDDGTVFQTTFDKETVNIPKLGSDLATIISLFTNLKAKNDFKDFIKIIYDGLNVSLIIFKAGEQSNIALFFIHELSDKELQNLHIRSYIDRIQELLDIDQQTLIKNEIQKKELEFSQIEQNIIQHESRLRMVDKNNDKKSWEIIEKEISFLNQEKKRVQDEREKLISKIPGKNKN